MYVGVHECDFFALTMYLLIKENGSEQITDGQQKINSYAKRVLSEEFN